MEARVLLVCLFVAAIVHGEQAPAGLCRSNERLLTCGCPRTCRNPALECKAVCQLGCFCEEGQVRNDEGLCVNLADCPPILSAYKQDTTEPRPNGGKCPENQEYRYCEPCNKTCDNPNPMCPAQCSRGCFCKNGLLRDKDGSCVTPDKCSKRTVLPAQNTTNATQHEVICGKDQVYKRCEKFEKTCTRPNPRVPAPCAMGCFCQEGYVKAPSGQCVKFEECPKGASTMNQTSPPVGFLRQPSNQTQVTKTNQTTTPTQVEFQLQISPVVHDSQPSLHFPSVEDCSPDEEYFFCGWCEPSCSTPSPTCPNKVCMRGCQCRPPLLRHHNGRCVESKDCFPGASTMNQTSPPVGFLRQPSNQTQVTKTNQTTTPTQVEFQLQISPVVHDSQPSLHFPSVEDCSPDEEYFFCGWCEPSCSTPSPTCPNKVCMRGCQCRPPLLRHHNGRCVESKDCFPGASTMNQTSPPVGFLRQPSNQTQVTKTNQTTTPTQVEFQLQIIPVVHDSQPSLHFPSVEDCSPDEEYFFCGWCEPSCSTPSPTCPYKVCMRGCQCRPPLLRHHNGRCVESKDCFPGASTMNQTSPLVGFLRQPSNQTQVTKTNQTTTPTQVEFQLQMSPVVHDSQPSLHFPSVEDCSPDEEYFFCGWCEPSCSTPSPTCPNKVCMRGCQCRPPLLRHHNGRCVESKDCFPGASTMNQTSPPVGFLRQPSNQTQVTKTNQTTTPKQVEFQLQISPVVHDSQPSLHFPSVEDCSPDEEYFFCGWCEPSCSTPSPTCPNKVCMRGCQCRPPLLRHHNGRCVESKDCFPGASTMNQTSPPVGFLRQPSNQTQVTKTNQTTTPTQVEFQLQIIPVVHDSQPSLHFPSVEDCSPDEEYFFCGWCEPSCSTPSPTCPNKVCMRGCQCRPPLLRHHNGRCVESKDCFPGASTMNQTSPPVGFLRQPSNQTQVTKTNQTTTPTQVEFQLQIIPVVHDSQQSLHFPSVEDCSPDEEYFFCGWCEPSCSTPSPTCPNKVCMRGCQCRPPLLRHRNGRCVESKDCFPGASKMNQTSPPVGFLRQPSNQTQVTKTNQTTTPTQVEFQLQIIPVVHDSQQSLHFPSVEDCSPDEEYFFCGWCEPSCSTPSPTCPNKVCMRGCQCRPPLLRHHNGRCVESKDCFPENCNNPNEEFVCFFGCEGRCDGRVCVQPRHCVLGCYCRIGLLRDTTGLCVHKDRCTNSTDLKGVAVNLKRKLSNDDKVHKTLTWKSLDEQV